MTIPSSFSNSEQTDSSDWADFVAAPTLSSKQHHTSERLTDSVQNSPQYESLQENFQKDQQEEQEEQEEQQEQQQIQQIQEQNVEQTNLSIPTDQPLQGFDTLDDVQRYALATLTIVLFNRHANDLNSAAFARTQAAIILSALSLAESQQSALLTLDPFQSSRQALIQQCVNLVGDPSSRARALQAMLALSVASGNYDARSRVFLIAVANVFQIPWPEVATVEMAVAIQLLNSHSSLDENSSSPNDIDNATEQTSSSLPPPQPSNSNTSTSSTVSTSSSVSTSSNQTTPKTVDALLIERRKKKQRTRKAAKIGGITLVGGVLFGLTGGLIAPALLTALAGVGVASAAGLAASGTVASGAVVGGLFGVAGAGFTVRKARNRISTNLEEFDFETSDDPRVIAHREKKAERQRRKWEKMVEARLAEEAAANGQLAIEAPQSTTDKDSDTNTNKKENTEENDSAHGSSIQAIDTEKELPRPSAIDLDDDDSDDEDDLSDENSEGTTDMNGQKKENKEKKSLGFSFMSGKKDKSKAKKEKKKKYTKLKVGSRGLESASHFPSLHLCICIPSWLTERSYGTALDQFEPALKQELPCSQHIALRWESRRLYEMGLAFAKFWASKATVTTVQQAYPHAVAAASTVAGAVAFAFAIPLTVMSCMDYIDNPWSLLVSRSNGAGEELADVLVERSYGNRPVSLFGYSIGARVVFKCLESLESRGAFGIVDNVYFMGAAITADPDRWKRIRRVVAGRIVNAYGSYDWALAFFHRGCGNGVYVSGLRKIEIEGVENLNMAYLGVEGHRELKDCVPRVMRSMGLGTGYIIMPPARLVRKRKRAVMRGMNNGDSPVCEEPIRGGQSPHSTNEETTTNQNGSMNTFSLPAAIGGEDTSDQAVEVSPNSSEAHSRLHADGKKKKQKSWLAWSSWTGSSGHKHKQPKNLNDPSPSSELINANMQSMTLEQNSNSDTHKSPNIPVVTLDTPPSRKEESSINFAHESDEIEVEEVEPIEQFDWEKQRRIWEEQERQMQERGYADSAVEIGARDQLILNVSIEVTGRRLELFLKQGAQLPIARKEEIFTNCLEDQRGIAVRLYEHENRTRSVSMNMLKYGERYPKLLGEMCLQLREKATRGKLRVAVALWATSEGDVCAEIEERFENGDIGDHAELRIAREELCTMEERIRLEAAERKRVEAQMQQELRLRAKQEVLALPAPTSSQASASGVKPDDKQ